MCTDVQSKNLATVFNKSLATLAASHPGLNTSHKRRHLRLRANLQRLPLSSRDGGVCNATIEELDCPIPTDGWFVASVLTVLGCPLISRMEDTTNVGESERKHKALRDDLEGSDEEEQIPSIFSCKAPGEIRADFERPSGSALDHEQRKRSFECDLDETKHKIFLSHSGQQKHFVDQLCVDLEKRGYFFPFFDQRSHSLPKGKDFVSLILQAARQCHVAVIVLSEKFLTSKWPMIELTNFYEAKAENNPGMYVMPLFFKLSISDLDKKSIRERWMPKWKELASRHEEIDANKCSEAVTALSKTSGFIFQQKSKEEKSTAIIYRSKVAYRRAVVKDISRVLTPDLGFGTSISMVGYDRICQMLSKQFVEDTTTGVLLLGLYGMPGLGKTKISKALCDYFRKQFRGKVCLLELGDSSTTLARQKIVLKKLCDYEDKMLNGLQNADEGWTLMKNYLKRDQRKRQSPVFLAIDNVTDESFGEAREYLEVGFCPNSKIMLTSISQEIVMGLLSNRKFCIRVPNLTKEEAETLFRKKAFGLRTIPSRYTDIVNRILGLCVEQCRFSAEGEKYWYDSAKQYHALALKALEDCFRKGKINNESVSDWEKSLKYYDRGSFPTLFKLLDQQFESFDPFEQLDQLDQLSTEGGMYWFDGVKQYHPLALEASADCIRKIEIANESLLECEKSLKDFDRDSFPTLFKLLNRQFESLEKIEQLVFLDIALFGEEWLTSALHYGEAWIPGIEDWINWIAGLHWSEIEPAKKSVVKCLKKLERSGIIQLPRRMITMHQLYKEFSVWLATKENLQNGFSENDWCVMMDKNKQRWASLRIVDLKGERISKSRVKECRSLVVLQLILCTNLRELNLEDFNCLRHLELRELKNLKLLTLPTESGMMRFMWLSGLDSLTVLDVGSNYSGLIEIVITRCLKVRGPLKLEGCSQLKTLSTELHLCPKIDTTFARTLSQLCNLYISDFAGIRRDQGDSLDLGVLRFCSQLKKLTLASLPTKKVLGLEQVISLDRLCLLECGVEEAPKISPHTDLHLEHAGGKCFWLKEFRKYRKKSVRDRFQAYVDYHMWVPMMENGAGYSKLHLKWSQNLGPSLMEYTYAYYDEFEDQWEEEFEPDKDVEVDYEDKKLKDFTKDILDINKHFKK